MQEYYYAVFAFHNVLEFQGKNHFQSHQPLQSFYRTLYCALAHFADHAPLFGTSNRIKACQQWLIHDIKFLNGTVLFHPPCLTKHSEFGFRDNLGLITLLMIHYIYCSF